MTRTVSWTLVGHRQVVVGPDDDDRGTGESGGGIELAPEHGRDPPGQQVQHDDGGGRLGLHESSGYRGAPRVERRGTVPLA